MTTRLEEIKNYLAFHNKPSRLADQPLVQDLAWAVARIEKLTAINKALASSQLEVGCLKAENAKLREALEWYDQASWNGDVWKDGKLIPANRIWTIAREALAEVESDK